MKTGAWDNTVFKMIKVGNSPDVGRQTFKFSELFPLYLNCCLKIKIKLKLAVRPTKYVWLHVSSSYKMSDYNKLLEYLR